jgi:hypothetical protein
MNEFTFLFPVELNFLDNQTLMSSGKFNSNKLNTISTLILHSLPFFLHLILNTYIYIFQYLIQPYYSVRNLIEY